MSQESLDCNGGQEQEQPSKKLVLTIFGVAVIMKLCIILVEILDFGNYLQRDGGQKNRN